MPHWTSLKGRPTGGARKRWVVGFFCQHKQNPYSLVLRERFVLSWIWSHQFGMGIFTWSEWPQTISDQKGSQALGTHLSYIAIRSIFMRFKASLGEDRVNVLLWKSSCKSTLSLACVPPTSRPGRVFRGHPPSFICSDWWTLSHVFQTWLHSGITGSLKVKATGHMADLSNQNRWCQYL